MTTRINDGTPGAAGRQDRSVSTAIAANGSAAHQPSAGLAEGLSQTLDVPASVSTRDIVIVGGGTAGLTIAALLRHRLHNVSITLIEPSEHHDYQSAWTLIGAGLCDPQLARRAEASCIPEGIEWIRQKLVSFLPEANLLRLDDGRVIGYGHLVVALGIQINWHEVEGLQAALGSGNVTSNFRQDLAPYTQKCIEEFKGGRALFTRPAMPMKCAAAAQNVMYLAADHFRRNAINVDLRYCTVGRVMHNVPYYHQALLRVARYYEVAVRYEHRLIAVDGPAGTATFEVHEDGHVRTAVEHFDFLHVTPPQGPPDVIRHSPLADDDGWLSVDRQTLRHTRYPNIFGLGDCTSTPNVKSVAAIRVQAPILMRNLVAAIYDRPVEAHYDGYGSCPLITSQGKVMLAESVYNGLVSPSFRLDSRLPRRYFWWLKRYYFPRLYWKMLEGELGLDWHAPRKLRAHLPTFTP